MSVHMLKACAGSNPIDKNTKLSRRNQIARGQCRKDETAPKKACYEITVKVTQNDTIQ